MKLVPADGHVLDRILEETFPIWSDGLSRAGYAKYNLGQRRTAWGARRLRRYALVDDGGKLLSTTKRYDFRARLDGREIDVVGIGAVFTPRALRGRGYATHIIEAIVQMATADGASMAVLFSEIHPDYYRRLGFVDVSRTELSLRVNDDKAGAPAILVRTAEDRDVPAIAALAAAMAGRCRFALVPDEDFVRYSLAKKRLLAGFSRARLLQVESFIVEEGASAVAFVILTTTAGGSVLESCGDRDPTGARVGAMLQVLRARTPTEPRTALRGSLPAGWMPPQMSIDSTTPAPETMMVRALTPGLLDRPLEERDVLFWHGDLF